MSKVFWLPSCTALGTLIHWFPHLSSSSKYHMERYFYELWSYIQLETDMCMCVSFSNFFLGEIEWTFRKTKWDNWSLGLLVLLKNTVQTQTLTYTHTLAPINGHTHTLPLWAPPKDWAGGSNLEIDEVTRGVSLFGGRRLPLKKYSAFMRHTYVKFKV
jgi:hypothetical protein